MAFSFIALVSGSADASGTGHDATASLNVQAGDLLVAWCKYEGGGSTSIAVAKNSGSPANTFTFDGGDFITAATCSSFGYLLAAEADASATFRMTLGTSKTFRVLMVLQFRPDAGTTVTKDGSSGATATSTAPNSGNFTTTGNDGVVVGAYGESSAEVTSAEQINGVGATEPSGSPIPGGQTSVWYRILSAPFSGGASSATLGFAQLWTCGGIAFKQEVTRRWILGSH